MTKDKKGSFLQFMINEIAGKIKSVEDELVLAKESRDAEDKSSAGDKYETGRAMMHLEIQNKETQRAKYRDIHRVLSAIDPKHHSEEVEIGSFVSTSKGNYFITVALGKIAPTNDESFYAISLASPLGKLLRGKKVNETILLNGKSFAIKEVI